MKDTSKIWQQCQMLWFKITNYDGHESSNVCSQRHFVFMRVSEHVAAERAFRRDVVQDNAITRCPNNRASWVLDPASWKPTDRVVTDHHCYVVHVARLIVTR